MKAKVMFNHVGQTSSDVFNNFEAMSKLLDENIYDYSLILFFEKDYGSNPKLTSFILTKLNGKDKYHYYFQRIELLEDNSLLLKDLMNMLEIKKINEYDYDVTSDILLKYSKSLLEKNAK